MDGARRDDPENLMLLCASQHSEIDASETLDVFTVDELRRLKREHEDRIRHLTGLGPDRATTVVRVVGCVHGNEVELSRETAAAAVIAGRRFPLFLESYHRHGLEIDLRSVPGEAGKPRAASRAAAASRSYFRAAAKLIDVLPASQFLDYGPARAANASSPAEEARRGGARVRSLSVRICRHGRASSPVAGPLRGMPPPRSGQGRRRAAGQRSGQPMGRRLPPRRSVLLLS
ncbi:hypothetical protein ACFV5E_42870 [Streptomyces chartreusis]|uniref:hypothetical protein n=1 Tax=Streptomyces chartreusis TaxID=1969 RepID=UPI003698A19E